ncbi:hypothetical protein CLV56_2717 [Mumia flava]|uniref:Uncharacterized protein n=1 Tax=Mumia flava TaxID=1348852 RepID=A0A2M9BKI6_9ACTN|nr:SHOCT domain-containing protein [Mumia flava]PJJ58466.1 hypothetical protein CLV56_2717 [Mumia flava]
MGDELIFGSVGLIFTVFLAFVAIFFFVVVAFMVIAVRRNVREARRHGLDPMTMETTAMARAIDGSMFAGKSLEARLAELTSLRDRQMITQDEYEAARSRALTQ